MRLLLFSFYFRPDLSAGSFRATALSEALPSVLGDVGAFELVTTQPNRYQSFRLDAPAEETVPGGRVRRLSVRGHGGGLVDQSVSFLSYALPATRIALWTPTDGVFATSSRLFTAFLGALIARAKRVPLYLDIRDIFVESIEPLLPQPIRILAMPVLRGIERFTIRSARKVNLVSEGFRDYFERRYPGVAFGYIPNGVDREFVEAPAAAKGDRSHGRSVGERRKIVYAGNLGEGQGLHHIVAGMARELEREYDILIVGDGGRRDALEQSVAGLENVRLLAPVRREELREIYADADVLFLHLNDMPAFRRVLPSKLFEYAATGKPILAGLAGYSADFVSRQLENASVFAPCDAQAAARAVRALRPEITDRSAFIERFARERLSRELAADIMATLRR